MSREVSPRLVNANELAHYLSVEEEKLLPALEKLEKQGFPKPIAPFGNWDLRAVDHWLDLKSQGLDAPKPDRSSGWVHPFNRCPPAKPPRPPSKNRGRPTYRVRDALSDYIKDFQGADNSLKNTIYISNAYLLPNFGGQPVKDLRAEEIRELMQQISNTPRRVRSGFAKEARFAAGPFDEDAKRRRKSTANRVLSVLKAALNHAYREGKVTADDEWRRVRPFPRTDPTKPVFLSEDQCRALVQHCAPDFRSLVQAALLTGARMAELMHIQAEDFDARAGAIFIRKAKYMKSRQVILTDEGCKLFRRLVKIAKADSPLLMRADGYRWHPTDPYPRLETACQLAGIKPRVTFHQLRHTYASLLAMAGTPMAVIAKNLGHVNTDACERYYAHLSPSYVRDTIRAKMPKLGIEPIKE